ncbi:2414_t:CDS:2 [Racocetra fulgida]|uniref:2414_t:CDS:1 n=1 Tax=Racocetra fulgida TaxID=60492 RepID=A0A9N8WPD3_9GLOM|nr:2414_t:CDS:2 [Racocetra fulgida]
MSDSTNTNSSANEEKLVASKLEKDKGNEFFKAGNISEALFRRAQAYISDGNTTRAKQDLEKLTEKNPDVKREWQRLKQKDREQDQKQRRELAGMFDRMKKLDEKEETEKAKKKAANESTNEPKISEIIEEPPKISEIVEDEAKISEIE